MGRFRLGESGNLSGRPKGSRNKAGADLRQQIIVLFENGGIKGLWEDICSVRNPAVRSRLKIEFLKFVLAQLKSIELPNLVGRLSDTEVEALYDSLIDYVEAKSPDA